MFYLITNLKTAYIGIPSYTSCLSKYMSFIGITENFELSIQAINAYDLNLWIELYRLIIQCKALSGSGRSP